MKYLTSIIISIALITVFIPMFGLATSYTVFEGDPEPPVELEELTILIPVGTRDIILEAYKGWLINHYIEVISYIMEQNGVTESGATEIIDYIMKQNNK